MLTEARANFEEDQLSSHAVVNSKERDDDSVPFSASISRV